MDDEKAQLLHAYLASSLDTIGLDTIPTAGLVRGRAWLASKGPDPSQGLCQNRQQATKY